MWVIFIDFIRLKMKMGEFQIIYLKSVIITYFKIMFFYKITIFYYF